MMTEFQMAEMLRRKHREMRYLDESIECPYCHADVGAPCRTRNGNRADMSHTVRSEYFAMLVTM